MSDAFKDRFVAAAEHRKSLIPGCCWFFLPHSEYILSVRSPGVTS